MARLRIWTLYRDSETKKLKAEMRFLTSECTDRTSLQSKIQTKVYCLLLGEYYKTTYML